VAFALAAMVDDRRMLVLSILYRVLRCLIELIAVLPRGVLGGSPEYLPHGRTQAGDRRLNFHESREYAQ
jgi:hypothetical protein